MGARMSCRGCVQANSRHLEDKRDGEGNPVCCLAASRRSGKAKQLKAQNSWSICFGCFHLQPELCGKSGRER